MTKIKKINFFKYREQFHFFDEYESLKLAFNDKVLFNSKNLNFNIKFKEVLVINIFSTYLSPKFKNEKELIIRKIVQKGHKGYGIIIDNKTANVDAYLKSVSSYNFGSNLSRLKRRLEQCFPINYKIFFGAILKDEFDFITDSLFKMQIVRLNNKKITNELTHQHDFFKEIAFPKINNKEASLFVIYNNKKPIGIALNFHYEEKLFCGSLITFDMDYYKFGIGNLLIYKLLDWCIENKYSYMDLGHGDFDYKKKWANHDYILETHILSFKSNLVSNFISYILSTQIMLKNTLKGLKFKKFIVKLKSSHKKFDDSRSFKIAYKFGAISLLPDGANIITLNIDNLDYYKLEQPVIEFLYSKKEHIDNIEVYKIINAEDSFIIKGKNNLVECNLTNL